MNLTEELNRSHTWEEQKELLGQETEGLEPSSFLVSMKQEL